MTTPGRASAKRRSPVRGCLIRRRALSASSAGTATNGTDRREAAAGAPFIEHGTPFIEHGTPAFLRTNLALFATGFATFALLYCVQPLMPAFSADFGISPTAASLSLSLTTGLLAVSMLFVAALSEQWGRKPFMVASLLLSGLLTLACAVLGRWPALLAARAAMGITLSGLPAVAMAYVGEEMHPKSVGLAMGLYVGGSGLGGMVGRLLTGLLTDVWGWRAAMLAIGVLGVACAVVLWRSLPGSRHFVAQDARWSAALRGAAGHLRDAALLLMFIEGFLVMGSFVTVYNYIGYRLLAPPFSLSQTVVGFIFVVYLFGIFSSAWMGALSGRIGRRQVLLAALALMLAGAAFTLVDRLAAIIAGIAVLTFGFFAAHSVASSWVGLRARQAKAQASSLYLFAYYLGSSFVGSAGGLFWSAAGWGGVVGLVAVLLTGGLFIAARLTGMPPTHPVRP